NGRAIQGRHALSLQLSPPAAPSPGLPVSAGGCDRRPCRRALLRGAGAGGAGRLHECTDRLRPGGGAGPAGTATANRTPALSSAAGRTTVQPGGPRPPAGGRRTGKTLGNGSPGTQAGRRGVGPGAAAAADARSPRCRYEKSLARGRTANPRTVAGGAVHAATEEGVVALPHRQGGRPSPGPRSGALP